MITEFACAVLGSQMAISSYSARRFIADALDARHRLPLTWATVVSRKARASNARLVAAKTRHLSVEAASFVDAAMTDYLDACLSRGRFESRLDGKVVAADPEVAAAHVAEALARFGDEENLDVRRVKAILVLCNHSRAAELLAAYAALRSRSGQSCEEGPPVHDEPADEQLDVESNTEPDMVWRDPHGQIYLVDHAGTHKVTAPTAVTESTGAATTSAPAGSEIS